MAAKMFDSPIIVKLEELLFSHRLLVIGLFVVVTLVMAIFATQLKVDVGFTRFLPLKHEYIQTFSKYQQEFGGGNRVLIALMAKQNNIFTPEFFEALKLATEEIFFIPGVDRAQVKSLFTPNTRYTEVVEDGISGGNVVPSDFQPTPQGLAKVRENILKADILGHLVANDFSGAIISADLMEFDPNTGEPLDYLVVARLLEDKIRNRFESEVIDVHIIGFAKIVGDIAENTSRVMLFFGATLLITAVLVYLYSKSLVITVILLGCPLIAVIWQFGLRTLLGYGIDPMSILVLFLVFAIGVSHGVQMISAVGLEVLNGADNLAASRSGFRQLVIPGGIALLSGTVGFISILLIEIEIIQEMAITASLGVVLIIMTHLILLPVMISFLTVEDDYKKQLHSRSKRMVLIWRITHKVTESTPATVVLLVAIGLFGIGLWQGAAVKIGDQQRGVPELHAQSRYNVDSEIISEQFSIGVDLLVVIVETIPNGCVNYDVMATIDRFGWLMRNVQGVQSVLDLTTIAKVSNARWNEGSLKWRGLPRNLSQLALAVSHVPTSSGLLNNDCSAMPVLIFTSDHKAETIEKVVSKVREFQENQVASSVKVNFRLASGNVGIMAATNDEVAAAQFPILVYVFSAVTILCLLTFKSFRGTLCIVIPLMLVSSLAYALMNRLEIGLKVNTLPVVALGVGIGVDYSIYIYSRLSRMLAGGLTLSRAYLRTLIISGNGVIFTGITLAIGVATWIFSPLKFQTDMGILLTFIFLGNMLAALLLLPALARWLLNKEEFSDSENAVRNAG